MGWKTTRAIAAGLGSTTLAIAAMAGAAGAQQKPPVSAWVKLCDPVPCRTVHAQHLQNGSLLVRAEISTAERTAGPQEIALVLTRSPTYVMPAGMRVFVYDATTWEKLKRKEKIDDNSVAKIILGFVYCDQTTCTARGQLSPTDIKALSTGQQAVALAILPTSQPITFEIPLAGLGPAMEGMPIDRAAFEQQRAQTVPSPPLPRPVLSSGRLTNKWVKLCEPMATNDQRKDFDSSGAAIGGAVNGPRIICLTHREEAKDTILLASAAVQQVAGFTTTNLMVNLPPSSMEISITAGVKADVYSKDQWAKLRRDPKMAVTGLASEVLKFTLCRSNGCTAETTGTAMGAKLLAAMQSGETLVLTATTQAMQPIVIELPLAGFKPAFTGAPSR